MLQPYSYLNVADNTGARLIRIIQGLKPSAHDRIGLGDIVAATVKKSTPRSSVKEHEVVKAVIVRQNYAHQRADGSTIRFSDNAGVIVNDDRTPRGTRVIGPVARELRERGFVKIISLAEEVLWKK